MNIEYIIYMMSLCDVMFLFHHFLFLFHKNFEKSKKKNVGN